MGRLTTHVLDTALGKPASDLALDLWRIGGTDELVGRFTTNADGRVDQPLLEGDAFTIGTYELVFHAGDYLRVTSPDLTEPLFLDRIPIRFGVSDAAAHYHVPLLISPFAYSTYRGS